ncbi:unnamed protein product [Phytomonas sp. Hart1]|nr:unnamed protein product [Phytomonas sp. Hart1]|eukprot:CCW66265.1 unnamed protein product [Phytomonas sp. isolate Hart1]
MHYTCWRGAQSLVTGSFDSVLSKGNWKALRSKFTIANTRTAAQSHSIIPTRHFQSSLPRLPIPPLSGTLHRYAAAVKALIPSAQYEKTIKLIKSFELKEGRKLQEELVHTDRVNKHTSYISSDLFEYKFKKRDPLPIHHHTCIFVRPLKKVDDMLMRATHWITQSVVFYNLYLNNTLRPDIFYVGNTKNAYYHQDWFDRTVALCPGYFSAPFMTAISNHHAFPLDLSQNDTLFNSTRVPGVLQDEIHAVGFMPHIIVQHRGHQFSVTVATEECNPLPEEEIYARLKAIVALNVFPARVDVGIFTSLPRSDWSVVRNMLLRDVVNTRSLEQIETSMFVLNLDDEMEDGNGDFTLAPQKAAKLQMSKSINRWWDKSFSVNVAHDGSLSVSYEESWCDGAAVRRYITDVQNQCAQSSGDTSTIDSDLAPNEPIQQLSWCIPADLEQVALKARSRLEYEANQLDLYADVLDNLPTRSSLALSNRGLTMDALLHLSLQLAWWRLYRSTVSSVQPLNLGIFRRGRTDYIYTATELSQNFTIASMANAVDDVANLPASTAKLCFQAAREYQEAVKLVMLGNGIHNHLFALNIISNRFYGRTPQLFLGDTYTTLCEPKLFMTECCSLAAAAALVTPRKEGYGISYTRVGNALVLMISTWKNVYSPQSDAAEFTETLIRSIKDIYNLFQIPSK